MEQKILAVGELSTVFSAVTDIKLGREECYVRQPGGLVLLTAMALKQFSVSCTVAGTVCSDALGRMLVEDMEKSGIDTGSVAISNGQTGYKILDGTGRRLIHSDSVFINKEIPEISSEMMENCRAVFVSADMLNTVEEKNLFSSLAEEAEKRNVLTIIGSAYKDFSDITVLSQADILCLDEKRFYLHDNVQDYFRGKTQVVLVFGKNYISVATKSTSLRLPCDMAICNKIPFGIAALISFFYRLDAKKDNLQEILSDASVVDALLQLMKSVCCVSEISELNGVSFCLKNNSNELLSFAQAQMDKAAPQAAKSKWRLRYHISAPSGWINDPNGLIQINGVYHVFYQLHPFSPEWGPMYWGHVSSTDLAHWKYEPIALAPDQPYEGGCFSGSAVNDNGILTLIYTAHNSDGKEVSECQCIARSYDNGKTFVKLPDNPVIKHYPKDGCADFRDPKVWKQNDTWYMVVGSGKKKRGRALLYVSSDLEHWDYRGVMCESDGTQGVMWECPNFCTVDGKDLLIFSPMEMKKHKNVYCVGTFDCEKGKYVSHGVNELDHGRNFYAAQVFNDESGRVILIAWMDMWGTDFPSQADGWAGALTLPRVLHMRGDTLLQQPVPELALLRKERLFQAGFMLAAGENPLQMLRGECMEISFTFRRNAMVQGFALGMRMNALNGQRAVLLYDGQKNAFSFPHGLYGKNDKIRSEFVACETLSECIDVRIFIDTCSIEVFIDEGSLCFTQRIYPAEGSVQYEFCGDGLEVLDFEAWSLDNAFQDKQNILEVAHGSINM